MIEEITWVRYGCEKCGKVWVPRTENLPAQCPNCQRRDWNVVSIGKAEWRLMSELNKDYLPKSEHLVDGGDDKLSVEK